jgi:hypothetical protein
MDAGTMMDVDVSTYRSLLFRDSYRLDDADNAVALQPVARA